VYLRESVIAVKRTLYIIIALILIIGPFVWLFITLLLSSIHLIEVNLPIAIYICMLAILAGALMLKFIHEGKLK